MPHLTPDAIKQRVTEFRRKLEEENDPDPVQQMIRQNKERAVAPNPLTRGLKQRLT